VSPNKRIGRYELLCELGRGGMAELHLAKLHGVAGFARLVAIKLILPHLATERTFVEQFLNEGNIAARLSHPNLCQVFELGEAEGQLYLAMEYLEGVSWEELGPALPDDHETVLRYSVGVLAQACDGLAQAHAAHIVHRDVSPSNMFVTVNGVCKVLDFGVSKLLTEGKHTRTGVLKGKLPYMSPEQIEGKPIDARSDVWAAGVMMWEALARKRLFDRETDFQVWRAITEESVPPLDYGAKVNAVIGRALTRDPDERYPTISAFAADLRGLTHAASNTEIGAMVRAGCDAQIARRAELVKRATTVRPIEEEEAAATMSLAMRGESLVIDRPRRRAWPIVLIAGAVIAGAVGFVATRKSESKPEVIATKTPVDAAPSQETDAPFADAISEAQPMPPDAAVKRTDHHRPKTTPTPSPTPSPEEPVAKEPGTLTVQSTPFARIFIDGKFIDQTPVYKLSLAPGKHTMRAVREDGRELTLSVKIESGKPVKFEQLPW